MPLGFLLKAVKGCDFDSDELYKSQEHAAFIKNMCLDLNQNESLQPGTESTQGDNSGVFTPIESNAGLCPLQLPEGNNYVIGYLESKETNKAYVFVYNDLLNHSIYQISGNSAYCVFVKQGKCLNFQLDPRNFISHGRAVLIPFCTFNKANREEERKDYLIFTDNLNPIRFISVTDALATSGFTTRFFDNDNCPDCDLINLGIATPNSCIGITAVPRETGDTKDNLLANNSFQFRVKFIDAWGRETEHGIISDLWYSTVGSCVKQSTGQPRCLDLSFDVGCAAISQVQIEFRMWNSNAPGELVTPTDWYLTDTIYKYDQTDPRLMWFNRTVNPDLKFDKTTNRITYRFCADKGTTAIAAEETNRKDNPIPTRAATVFTINKGIGTANHDRDFPVLDKSLLDQISFDVVKPTPDTSCVPKSRNITVWGHIKCIYHDRVVNLRVQDGKTVYGIDDSSNLFEFQQHLPTGQEGFIGYFAGTSDFVISKQYRHDKVTHELVETGLDLFKGLPNNFDLNRYEALQKWEFKNVVPGRKVFRVANQSASASTEYWKTSIASTGTENYPGHSSFVHKDVWEIVINDCEGDVDLLKVESFVICDLTKVNGGIINNVQNGIVGYLREDEVSKIPIEKAVLDAPNHTKHPKYTDHNGYYFAMSIQGDWEIDLYAVKDCKKVKVKSTSTTKNPAGQRFVNEILYQYPGTVEYKKSDRIYIKGRVTLCDSPTVGVSGVAVILTGGGFTKSDDLGYYTIIAHDQGDTGQRVDNIVFSQVGLCNIGRCDDPCSNCFPLSPFTAPPCTGSDRIFNVPVLSVVLRDKDLRGPQNGGRYELGIVPYYNIGQPADVQRVTSHAVDIPTIGETGLYDFSRIRYTINPNILFPLDVRYFTFVISPNINWTNFLTWVGEKVEFVDNTGNVNKVNPTQIKIYYRGLAEYNKRNNLSTNATWQFTQENGNDPIVGEKVEFIANGDGSLFTSRVSSLIKLDKAGAYFLVNYTEELKGLTDGVQIKLIRPSVIRNTTFFNEQCIVIPVNEGKVDPKYLTGFLNYYDSYMVQRQIPIPFYNTDGTQDVSKSVLKTYAFPFEHHSPSDFWSSHARNIGRPYVVNPFQNKRCLPTEISLSASLVNNGLLNGLSYFSAADSIEYDSQEFGSITAVLSEVGYLNVICHQNFFRVRYDDNLLRVRSDNTVSANNANNRLGRPDARGGDNFGCQVSDINTLREMDGIIMFVDRTRSALVAMRNGDATDVSVNYFKGWLGSKIKAMIQNNEKNSEWEIYAHGTFDPKLNQYLLTFFRHPSMESPFKGGLTDADYVNQSREKNIGLSETIAYHPQRQSLVLSHSFTPEYYGTLSGQQYDTQLISFRQGKAWVHHSKEPGKNKSYNNFYGVQCECVYEVVLAIEQNAEKDYNWTEVLCKEQLFFADRILTGSGQYSRILKAHWDKRKSFWTADFKMDLKTHPDKNIIALSDPNKIILEGNPLNGKWIKVRYVGQGNNYFEFNGVHIFATKPGSSGTSGK